LHHQWLDGAGIRILLDTPLEEGAGRIIIIGVKPNEPEAKPLVVAV
jgi:hypothetical protein